MFSTLARRTNRQASAPSLSTRKSRLRVLSLEARDVPATGLGVANDYSAFVLHDVNLQYSDVEGRVAVGGNAKITGYAVGDHVANSNGTRDDLIVGGNLDISNGQVFYGNTVYGGTGTIASNFGHPNGTVRQQANLLDFGKAETDLDALSDSYAGMATTGSYVNQYGTIILNGKAGQNVFNVPASVIGTANDLRINAPAGATVIVNFTGTSAQMQFMGYHLTGGIGQDGVILNFPQATSLTLQGIGIFGNVLAPRAAVNFSNGQINGTLVASSWSGYGQINFPQQPPITPPPPPPSCGCGTPAPSQISGLVYYDQNSDGQAQDSEQRLSGVTVTLTGQDQSGHSVTKTTTTDAGGIFVFTGLDAGTYSIQVTTPSGYNGGQSTVGAFGGTAQPNLVTNIGIPAGQSSGAYNFGELKDQTTPPPACGCQPSSTSANLVTTAAVVTPAPEVVTMASAATTNAPVPTTAVSPPVSVASIASTTPMVATAVQSAAPAVSTSVDTAPAAQTAVASTVKKTSVVVKSKPVVAKPAVRPPARYVFTRHL
jgi:choice-of-anchor A domain-containing protein